LGRPFSFPEVMKVNRILTAGRLVWYGCGKFARRPLGPLQPPGCNTKTLGIDLNVGLGSNYVRTPLLV